MARPSFSQNLPKGFSFLPKRIIAMDEQGKVKHFRWRSNRYGHIQVESQSEFVPFTKSQKCLVCLDPKLMFHRRCPMPVTNKADLNRIARDFFPFSPEQNVHFARIQDNENPAENLIFALPENDWLTLQKNIPAVAMAILPASAEAESIQEGILQRCNLGPSADLISQPSRILPPAIHAFMKLSLLFVTILAVGYALWSFQYDWQRQKLLRDIGALQTEVMPVKQKYEAMQIMHATLQDFATFQNDENNQVFVTLGRLIQTLPAGISIDRIEYKENQLNIGGLGRDPKEWLAGLGINPATIEITPLPQFNRYTVSIPVSSTAPKQTLQP